MIRRAYIEAKKRRKYAKNVVVNRSAYANSLDPELLIYTRGQSTTRAKRLVRGNDQWGNVLRAKRLGEIMVWGETSRIPSLSHQIGQMLRVPLLFNFESNGLPYYQPFR